jgi:hypothetical protein
MTRRHQAFDARDRRPVDDEDAFDEHGAIRDGFALRVPMEFMDSMQREIAISGGSRGTRLHDGQGGPVGHKPGFVYASDASVHDARDEARAEYIKNLSDAWRSDRRPADAASTTVPRMMDEASAQAIRDAAYLRMCNELINAWRTK